MDVGAMDVGVHPWSTLQPGEAIWWDVDDVTYHGSELANRGQLDDLDEAPAIWWGRWVSGVLPRRSETDAMWRGRLLHTRVLQPELVAQRYALEPERPDFSQLGKPQSAAYRQALAKWREETAAALEGLDVVTSKDWYATHAMAASVRAHEHAARLLEGAMLERSIVWREPTTGMLVRVRPDIVSAGVGMRVRGELLPVVADLKSTDDPHPRELPRTVATYAYHRQAAIYLDAVEAVTGRSHAWLWITVRSRAPWETAIYPIGERALAQGRDEYRALLAELQRRRESRDGVADWQRGINRPVDLPRWARQELTG